MSWAEKLAGIAKTVQLQPESRSKRKRRVRSNLVIDLEVAAGLVEPASGTSDRDRALLLGHYLKTKNIGTQTILDHVESARERNRLRRILSSLFADVDTEQALLTSARSAPLDAKVLCNDINDNLRRDATQYAAAQKNPVSAEVAGEIARQLAVDKLRAWMTKRNASGLLARLDYWLAYEKTPEAINSRELIQRDHTNHKDFFNPFYSDPFIRGLAKFIAEANTTTPGSFGLIYKTLGWTYGLWH